MDELPFPAPLSNGFCQALVLSYQSRRVLEGRGCGIDATYTWVLTRVLEAACCGVVGAKDSERGLDGS